MEKIDGRLATMNPIRKMARRQGEEFADEIAYMPLKNMSKTIHSKYNRLVQEVKLLEQPLGYEDNSTGDVSSSSSSPEETFANPVNNEYDSASH